jgi:tRNA modification GTPase
VALVGAPNAGKSSIFNILLRFERAIVTPVPGTTRDLVSERVELGGLPLRLVDTAGLRDTEDVVERIGVERTRTAIADADLVVVVVDAAEAEDGPTRELLDATEGLDRLAVWNKVDLAAPPAWLDELAAERGVSRVRASAATGEGIESLRTAILEAVGGRGGVEQDGILVTNARHHALLQRASGHLTEAARALGAGFSEEIALVGLHGALRDLGELTGETAIDDILNRIFSTFCIGK